MSAEQLKALERRVAQLESIVAGIRGVFVPGKSSGEVADDAELDSKYGNPIIKRDPTAKYWTGESFMGRRYSDATPDYLDALAKYKDSCAFMARKNGNPAKLKYAGYDEKDAARARGWAKRLRDGWSPKEAPASFAADGGSFGDSGDGDSFASEDFVSGGDDIPFIVDAQRLGWRKP